MLWHTYTTTITNSCKYVRFFVASKGGYKIIIIFIVHCYYIYFYISLSSVGHKSTQERAFDVIPAVSARVDPAATAKDSPCWFVIDSGGGFLVRPDR